MQSGVDRSQVSNGRNTTMRDDTWEVPNKIKRERGDAGGEEEEERGEDDGQAILSFPIQFPSPSRLDARVHERLLASSSRATIVAA